MHTTAAVRSRPLRRGGEVGRKPVKFPKAKHLGIRIDDATARALDEEVKRENAARPGLALGRSDVVRMLIVEALAARAKTRSGK